MKITRKLESFTRICADNNNEIRCSDEFLIRFKEPYQEIREERFSPNRKFLCSGIAEVECRSSTLVISEDGFGEFEPYAEDRILREHSRVQVFDNNPDRRD